MVLALDPHVVGGVQVEHEELLRKGDCADGLGEAELEAGIPEAGSVKDDGEGGVGEEGEGDGGVLEVVEVIGGDGPVVVEGLVAGGADEELHGDGEGAADHDEGGFEVAEARGREPGGGCVGVGVEGVESGVVEEVPQADEEEAEARCNVTYKGAHPHDSLQSATCFVELLLVVKKKNETVRGDVGRI